MRSVLMVCGCLALAGVAFAEKPVTEAVIQPARVPCELGHVARNWDFSISDQGFRTRSCDPQGGVAVWEWGATEYIPDAPGRVWGTILNGNYPNDSGQGLVSPSWTVDGQSYLVEVVHYFDTENVYDGCNLIVVPYGNPWIPMGGYTVTEISPSESYYAWCVDGEPGWTGSSGGWRVDCFDVTEFMGMRIAVEFDFGSDVSLTGRGWYISRVRVGAPGPPEAVCCAAATGECFITTEEECVAGGNRWHPDWMSCDPNPCPPPSVYEPTLQVGSWLNAEPWHNWAASDSIPLQVSIDTPPWDPIVFVEFYWDSAGTWKLLGVDENGTQPWFDTIGHAPPVGDGWSLVANLPDPLPSPTVLFKVVAHTASRGEIEGRRECDVDPAPPSLGKVRMQDWTVTEDDYLGVPVDPNGTDIDYIIVWATRMGDVYEKGVPGINQHPHSDTHCAPTAAAQCLKYFEQVQGDSVITGGLGSHPLVDSLASRMATNQGPEPGTYLSDWIGGLADWIRSHGAGYTLRPYWHFNDEGWTWVEEDWRRIRNELERSQDVLLGVFWERPGGGYAGGHAVTLNSIVNQPLPNDHVLIDFKDPWTGETEWGELDPATGRIEHMTGAGGGGAARIGATLIACPGEENPASGGPGEPIYIGPDPYPDPVPVPLPEPGAWFIHVVIVNTSAHAHRITKIGVRSNPSVAPQGALPEAFALGPCTPNPFWASTEIAYALPVRDRVSLAVYDVAGRRVRTLVDGDVSPGFHRAAWDGRDGQQRPMGAGIYYIEIVTSQYRGTARVMLLR